MKNILNKGKLGPELEPGQLKVEMANVKNSQAFQIIMIISLIFVNSYKNFCTCSALSCFHSAVYCYANEGIFLLHGFWPVYKWRLIIFVLIFKT